MADLPFSQACENNKEPILSHLRDCFADRKLVLEIGSGTGQHAVHFATHLPHLIWQTSDLPANHERLEARLAMEGPENVRAPLDLDVQDDPWPIGPVDGIFSANAIHIMSWEHVVAMFRGIGRVLEKGGFLVLYGPYKYDGDFTTDSNAKFDLWLKERDPVSGIRDFEEVNALAEAEGLALLADHAMPANNQLLVWERR